ncbi:MAG TPA: DNA polymerase/3'-5' exonuclease PolX [Thermoleophilaceae bacterium]|nr:DNA polymerase/3'-5' exonuclease PolX [Thermoleophilaceae bacterium]
MRNAEIAAHFDELGDLYELDGAVVYRVVAYRNAAKAIREAPVSVEELARQGRATTLAGVGRTIAEKIDALLETGQIPSAAKLKAKYPPGLVEITRIPGLGPKKARKLFDTLGVDSLDALRAAVEQEKVRDVPGFGRKTEETIALAIDTGDTAPSARILHSQAARIADSLVPVLRDHPACEQVEVAGSLRRWTDTCKDIDIVATATDARALVDAFAQLPLLGEVHTAGEAGARGVTHNGIAVDFRIVAPENWGNLLQHLTGSGKHNEAMRTEAVKRGFHVSEYGVIDDSTGTTHACATEEEVYALLGMQYIPPELRENRGELEAARKHALPVLVEPGDVRGELHCHTVASDGRQTIEQMAEAARERGYGYIAITDHSASHGFGNDVQPDALKATIERIAELNASGEYAPVRILAGSEVNIGLDGSLDYDDDLVAQLDWVMASVHTSFRIGEKEMTKRVIAAMENPLVDCIGHPTGRLIERREPYAIDMEKVIEAAARTGTFLEINGNPDRRDMNDIWARHAGEAGVHICLTSDGHGSDTLRNVRYAVATARRAWLTKDQIANAREWSDLDALRKRSV